MDIQNLLIAVIIIGARLFVPLLIPRFPFPAIIACMLIDGIDQTIFQKYTTINLDGYQSYDKALDIYYLSVAYLSIFKNWNNQAAIKIAQFLFFYRMFGLTLFELTQIRPLLFIFPNTFEYFFIFVSGIALFYDIKKLSTKFLLSSAAFIWIFIKLPQEYWIHIAQLDTTDFIKEKILGVPASSTWSYALSQNIWVIPAIGIIALILGIAIYRIYKNLPKPDHKLIIRPTTLLLKNSLNNKLPNNLNQFFAEVKFQLIEKLVMVGLISIIFAQIFPNLRGTNIEVVVGVVLVILVNTVLGYFILKSSKYNYSVVNNFFPMLIFNAVVAFIYVKLIADPNEAISYLTVFLFAYIITLLTILYDRYYPYLALKK